MILASSFLIGVASFMRQAALSLDRLPEGDLSALIKFYESISKHTVHDVRRKIEQVRQVSDSKERSISRMYREFQKFIKALLLFDVSVSSNELYFVERALKHLEELIADRTLWKKEVMINRQIELAYAASLLSDKLHPRYRREAINRVFHLNHAEHLKLKSVEELAGHEWLK